MELVDVERAMLDDWAVRGADAPSWPDPHPNPASSRDEEYERVTDWSKYRIVGLRVHSWTHALVHFGLATTAPAASRSNGDIVRTSFWLRPTSRDAAAVRVYLTQKDGVADSGVDIGGRWLPPCGCDACDSGSEHELDSVDALFAEVLSGDVAGDHRAWL